MLQELVRDVRFGLRMMARTPGFTAMAVITIALGVGGNTAIFSLVNGVLLKPSPYPEAERVLYLRETNLARGWGSFSISPLNFWDWQSQNRSMELIAAYRETSITRTGGDRPETLSAYRVSEDFLEILGGMPVLGRGFTVDDLDPEREPVVVLGFGYWQSSFGGDPGVIGQSVLLSGLAHTAIGVLPEGWQPLMDGPTDVVLPLRPDPWWFEARGSHFLRGIARMNQGVTVEQAQADLSAIASALEAQYPGSNDGWGVAVFPLEEVILGDVRPQLLILLASVGLVLVIACANVAQMILARACARGQEMAIRTALGAGRGRMIKQLLAESVLLSLVGGAAGVLTAFGILKALTIGWPQILPRMEQVNIDGTVLLYTAGLSLIAGLLFGLMPASTVIKSNIGEALRKSSLNVTGDTKRRRLRAFLVVAEVGLAVVLLVGSGLLVRSFIALQGEDPGFDPADKLVFTTPLPGSRYPTVDERRAYVDATISRLASIPGVSSAVLTTLIPVSGEDAIWGIEIEDRPVRGVEDEISALTYRITPGYFEAMGIPLLLGRTISSEDRDGSIRVIVVSESFAEMHFPGESPIGKRLRFGDEGNPFMEIVGVVGDVQHYSLGRTSMGQAYLPFAQRPASYLSFVLQASVPPLSLVNSVRTAIQTVDPELPLVRVRTMQQIVHDDISGPRFRTTLLTSFGLTALLLAVVGLYGVISYNVAQRSREIGMRMALGAQQSRIFTLIMRDGLPLVGIGVIVGLAAAYGLTQILESMLFGVGVRDLGVFVAAPVLLVAVAAVALLVPAIRATRVDPVRTLSME